MAKSEGAGSRAPRPVGRRAAAAAPQGCGLCGARRDLSDAHVPAKAAGNRNAVTRRFLEVVDGRMQATDPRIGGMHTRALCTRCNSRAGGDYDPAYTEFHDAVARAIGINRSGLTVKPAFSGISAVPALVARSVLCGAFALNTQMRIVHPDPATDLASGAVRVRWPSDWKLVLTLNSGVHRIEGGMSGLRLLPPRIHRMPFAEVWFPPLAWAVVSRERAPRGLGPSYFDLTRWVDVTHWINLTQQAPFDVAATLSRAPMLDSFLLPGDSPDVWSMMYAPEIGAVVLGDASQSA